MKFYTDGSRIGLAAGQSFIGWSAVCNRGVIVAEGRCGGSNINAEIFAIRDLVKYLANKQLKVLDADNGKAEILTDSKVSIQIMLNNPPKMVHRSTQRNTNQVTFMLYMAKQSEYSIYKP